ncbi:MAG: Ig-like domain-containing protein [Lachnospiraceae bacterium]|nr:Ig-like domain-containing protein [Lachnospiraceae bacterium]
MAIESVESSTVTVVLGEDTGVTLPATVTVTYNNSTSSDEAVTWDEADVETVSAAFAAGTAGTYTVNGTLEDGTAVTCTVTIKYTNMLDADVASFEISSTIAAEKYTITGSGINLPATDDPYEGSYSMHWYRTSATTSSVTYNDDITLAAGQYTFECVAQGYAGDTVTLQILDADGNVLFAGDPTSMTGWAVWQTPTVSFELTKETTVRLQIVVSMQAGGWGTADCLYLYQTGEVQHTHTYGEPVFNWAEDYSSAEAVFTCTTDSSHVVTVAATVTSEITKEATETEDGVRTYTATVTFEEQTYTDTKTEPIAATGGSGTEEPEEPEDPDTGDSETEDPDTGDSGSETPDTGNTGAEDVNEFWDEVMEEVKQVQSAGGGPVTVKGNASLNAIPNDVMQDLVDSDVTLVFSYEYDGEEYNIVIPAGTAVDDDTEWYGPLWLYEHYGTYTPDDVTDPDTVTNADAVDSAATGDSMGYMLMCWLFVMTVAGVAVISQKRGEYRR